MAGSARIRTVMFSLATVLSLGFGAVQAFAAPGTAQNEAALACNPTSCYYSCQFYGYRYGLCEEFNGSSYCECYGEPIVIQPSPGGV